MDRVLDDSMTPVFFVEGTGLVLLEIFVSGFQGGKFVQHGMFCPSGNRDEFARLDATRHPGHRRKAVLCIPCGERVIFGSAS